MSDPVTNIEIEDVLSSIRRLVSEGEKLRDPGAPTTAVSPAATTDANQDEAPSVLELGAEHRADEVGADSSEGEGSKPDTPVRFVLTSAFRVEEPQTEARSAEDDATQDDATQDDPAEDDVTEDVTTEIQADPVVEDDPEEAVGAALQGEIVWTDEDDPEPEIISASLPDTSEAGASDDWITDDEDVSQDVPDWVAEGQAELDALETGDISTDAVLTDGADAIVDEVEVGQAEQDTPIPQVEPVAPSGFSDRRAIESTIAELEAAISDAADEWEPDGSEETPVMDWTAASDAGVFFSSRFASGGPVEDAEIAEPATRREEAEADEVAEKFEAAEAYFAEAEIEDAPDPLDDQLTAYLEQDEVLDEETLRRMVAEIVREELQGPLGERITRNVRKLVRREIYRALAEQGFE